MKAVVGVHVAAIACVLAGVFPTSTASLSKDGFAMLARTAVRQVTHPKHHTHHKKKKKVVVAKHKSSFLPKRPEHHEDDIKAPRLPAVGSVLETASATLKDIGSQAVSLQTQVEQAQKEYEEKMVKQKAVFDRKLREQDESNNDLEAQNTDISKATRQLEDENTQAFKRAREAQAANRMARIELQTLLKKFGVAHDFLAHALNATDDSKAPELFILRQAGSGRQGNRIDLDGDAEDDADDDGQDGDDDDDTDGGDGDDDDRDDDGPWPSFLAMGAKTRRVVDSNATKKNSSISEGAQSFLALGSETRLIQNDVMDDWDNSEDASAAAHLMEPDRSPGDILKVMQQGVTRLAAEEQAGEAKLKTLFLEKFRQGVQHRNALLARQRDLNATRAAVVKRRSQLKIAESHLERTKGKLTQRLRGIGLFLQKLAHVALATPDARASGIKSLPAEVTISEVNADDQAGGTEDEASA